MTPREGVIVAEEEASAEAVKVRVARTPTQPTEEERRQHDITHTPFRSWCRSCVLGRARNDPFVAQDDEKDKALPTVGHDYGFLGKGARAEMPMLCSKSSRTLWIDAEIVPCKGDESEYSQKVMK